MSRLFMIFFLFGMNPTARADFFFFCQGDISQQSCINSVFGEETNSSKLFLPVDTAGKSISERSMVDLCNIDRASISCEYVMDIRQRCIVSSKNCSALSTFIGDSNPPYYSCEDKADHSVVYAAIQPEYASNHQVFGGFEELNDGRFLKALYCVQK